MNYTGCVVSVHWLKTSLRNESNILWNTHTYVICAGVYVDPKPRVNMHNVTLGAAGKWPVPAVLALGESVDAVPDCPNQNSDNDD